MSTLDDLRTTLAAHAEDATGSGDLAAGRRAALDRRIARTRTRRRAGLAGGVAAAVLAAGGAVVGLGQPDHHASAPRIAGHVLAPTVTVTDFGYRLARTGQSTPGQQRFTLHLPAAGRGRVVELVGTGLGSGTATLRDQDVDVARVGGGTTLAAPVPTGSDRHDVTVVLRGTGARAQVGLAVYERDASLPAGIGNGTAVFRSHAGAATLLGGAWGRPGQDSLVFTVHGPARVWSLSDACTVPGTSPTRLRATYTVDGKAFGSFGCHRPQDGAEDAGAGGSQPDGWRLSARAHTVRVRLEDSAGHAAHAAGVVLGGALYAVGPQTRIHGIPVDHQIEADGRAWVLDRVVASDQAQVAGPAYVKAVLPSGRWRTAAHHLVPGDGDLEPAVYDSAVGFGMPALGEVLTGSRYLFSVTPRPAGTERSGVTVLVYRPA